MTNKEFYQAIVSANINDELTAFAENAIKKLDEKNRKKRESTSPNQAANEELKTQIFETVSADPDRYFTAKELADTHGVSTQKISALVGQMVKANLLDVAEVKDSKKNKVKGYRVRGTDEVEE